MTLTATVQKAWLSYHRHPSRKQRERLVLLCEPEVRQRAKHTVKQFGSRADRALAYQAGVEALLKAVDSYRDDHGASFLTFARRRVFYEVVDAFRFQDEFHRRKKFSTISLPHEALEHRVGGNGWEEEADVRMDFAYYTHGLKKRDLQMLQLRCEGYLRHEIGQMTGLNEDQVQYRFVSAILPHVACRMGLPYSSYSSYRRRTFTA